MSPGSSNESATKGRRIHRLLKLVSLLQSGRGETTRSLAEQCGVSRRTIFRDLELLRESEIQVEFDEQTQSFVMQGCRSLRATTFTSLEAMALLALCLHVGNHDGLPLMDQAASAVRKIESNLPSSLRDELTETLRTIEIALLPKNPLHGQDETFRQLAQAVTQRRSVRIRYYDATKRKEISTKLNPYRVFFRTRSWFVVGRSSLHRQIRTFNIGRVMELTELEDTFRIPRGFSLKRHFGNAWQMIPDDGPDQRVKVRFMPDVARNVHEVSWHPTQETRWLADGSLHFEVKVSGLREISWWLLGYGDQVEVLQPKALRELIKKRLLAAAEQYRAAPTSRKRAKPKGSTKARRSKGSARRQGRK